jgi:hypothetical protein
MLSVDGWSLASSRRTSRDILHYRLDIEHPTFDLEWRGLVRDYTQRKLSQKTDRILAISGIATAYKDFAEKRRRTKKCIPCDRMASNIDNYVAGHWLYRLPNDLLWTVYTPQSAKPLSYQGPSWSWTSVNGPVGFGSVLWDTDVLGFRADTDSDQWMDDHDALNLTSTLVPPRPRWDILNVRTKLVDNQAPCGAVKESILSIRARLRSFQVIASENCTLNPSCIDLTVVDFCPKNSEREAYHVKLSPDTLPADTFSSLTLMPFGWSRNGPFEYILRGLAMKEVERARDSDIRRFERCGVFQARANDGDDSDECEEGIWQRLMPFYSTLTEEVFELV